MLLKHDYIYGLKILENIEIEHIFQSKAFFYLTNNLHTSCFSAFKWGCCPMGGISFDGGEGGGRGLQKKSWDGGGGTPPPPPTHPTMGNPALTKGGVEPSNNWGTWRVCSNFFAKKGWGKSERRVDSFFYCFSSNKILKRLISHILPIVKTLTTST